MKSHHPILPGGEPAAVRQRYSRRQSLVNDDRYSMLNPATWQIVQERQRRLLQVFIAHGWRNLAEINLVEVGCGSGRNLLELLRLGFSPSRMTGIELLPERLAQAREVLPQSLTLLGADALKIDLPACSQDIVYQAVVFSSLLDDEFQKQLAERMWQWVKPGGAVLWYDFIYNNPSNPDVRGVGLQRIKALFPEGRIDTIRVTLAPPIARRVCQIHPSLYHIFNSLPWLRTHVLCWIEKT
jgi:SAM-dependent methyltransferase